MAAIELQGVTKRWGSTVGVGNVSFNVDSGSFVILLGPSGCGKSTTLRMIAGLEEATSGRLIIGGSDVTDAPPSERALSMVFQSYALFPHLSVRENIVFGLKVRKVSAGEREQRLARVAEIVGLQQVLERKPGQLSGGQRQRRACAGDHRRKQHLPDGRAAVQFGCKAPSRYARGNPGAAATSQYDCNLRYS